MRYAIDATKLETELGWRSTYTFETGIAQTIEWYLENKEWWENILNGKKGYKNEKIQPSGGINHRNFSVCHGSRGD